MSNAADQFRRAMEGGTAGGVVGAVQVASVKACDCGCGRPAGVAVVSQLGTMMLRTPEELGALLGALHDAGRALGWKAAGRG